VSTSVGATAPIPPGGLPRLRLSVVSEAILAAIVAAVLAALLFWLGPPGSDLVAHLYQRDVFREHGLLFWNNFWYSGRYSFVAYSLVYYPLAAVAGIGALAVASISAGAFAFALLVGHTWGTDARWSSRAFALVWPAIVLSAAFPFVLGLALALVALVTLQRGHQAWFGVALALTLGTSPLAFLLLLIVLAALWLAQRDGDGLVASAPSGLAIWIVAALGLVGAVTWRLFPSSGHFPFSTEELLAAALFCVIGMALSWRVVRARPLRYVFLVYLLACLAAFILPSAVGENVARLRFVAIPIAVLTLSLRRWRPLPIALGALVLATSWNVSPLAASFVKGASDPSASAAYWAPAVAFLQENLGDDYRVEAVDTVGHWEALHLPRAGIPIARGWFRQDDFPQNRVLYGAMGERRFLAWLKRLSVRYVVLADAPTDYSARAEAKLLRSGRLPLTVVMQTRHLTIFEVPDPRPLLTGPGNPRLLELSPDTIRLRLDHPGTYRLAVRYSPYWTGFHGCLSPTEDGMMRLTSSAGGTSVLRIDLTAGGAARALTNPQGAICSWSPLHDRRMG
jgi:hypothetical protein